MAVYRNNDELFTGYGSAHDYSTASSSGIAYLQRGDYLTLRVSETNSLQYLLASSLK